MAFKANVFIKIISKCLSLAVFFKKSKHSQFLIAFSNMELYQTLFFFSSWYLFPFLIRISCVVFLRISSSCPFSFCLLSSALKILLPSSASHGIRDGQDDDQRGSSPLKRRVQHLLMPRMASITPEETKATVGDKGTSGRRQNGLPATNLLQPQAVQHAT